MKYTFRKIKLMISLYKNVHDDTYRKNELLKAFFYMFKHPSLFFKKQYIECGHDSVLKNVNTIVNRPYFEELYKNV